MNTADHVLFLIKTRGPQTAQQLAALLELSSMGVRRHLEAAQQKGLLAFEDLADKVGRPARRWSLTDAGHARFPDRHPDLTVQLIGQVRALFGEQGLDKLIRARETDSERHYAAAMADSASLRGKAEALAAARDAEGYMAEIEERNDGSVLLVENHCPICAAATACQQFCRSELEVFQRALGPACAIERAEHLLSGGRRCVYVIRPVAA
jgi:predicted ArsR family transcriptional regulator